MSPFTKTIDVNDLKGKLSQPLRDGFIKLMEKLPSDADVSGYLSTFCETDFVRVELYHCLPFLVSLIGSKPCSFTNSIVKLCHYICMDIDIHYPSFVSEVLESVRDSLRRSILVAMDSVAGSEQEDREVEFGVLLGGLCTIAIGEGSFGDSVYRVFLTEA